MNDSWIFILDINQTVFKVDVHTGSCVFEPKEGVPNRGTPSFIYYIIYRHRAYILLGTIANLLGTILLNGVLVLNVLQTGGGDDGHTVLVVLGEGLYGIAKVLGGDDAGIYTCVNQGLYSLLAALLRITHVDLGVTGLYVGV